MSRECARITKPPYTPPRGTCLFVNLLLDWELLIISAWVLRTNVSIRKLTLAPSHTFSSLFGTVHCPFSPWELAHTSPVHPNPWHDTLCHHKPHYIFPQNSHHTYLQGISIAFPRYSHATSTLSWLDLHVIHATCLIDEPHASWALP